MLVICILSFWYEMDNLCFLVLFIAYRKACYCLKSIHHRFHHTLKAVWSSVRWWSLINIVINDFSIRCCIISLTRDFTVISCAWRSLSLAIWSLQDLFPSRDWPTHSLLICLTCTLTRGFCSGKTCHSFGRNQGLTPRLLFDSATCPRSDYAFAYSCCLWVLSSKFPVVQLLRPNPVVPPFKGPFCSPWWQQNVAIERAHAPQSATLLLWLCIVYEISQIIQFRNGIIQFQEFN